MGRLDASAMRYLSRDDFRVLTAVEMGMKNHEIVPVELIVSIAQLRHGGAHKILSTLLQYKLIQHDRKKYDGYALTYKGYDYLALRTFLARGKVSALGRKIGVGKESDVYMAIDANGKELAIKFHRLGRISFRQIKRKRDYLKHRQNASWLYMSRLAALKEFAFMQVLQDAKFPVPEAVDYNRHAVVMSLVDAFPMTSVKELDSPGDLFDSLMALAGRLAAAGLVHADFNEFNLLVNANGGVTLIDFPQMVPLSHPDAEKFFDHDMNCLRLFFERRFNFVPDEVPSLKDAVARTGKKDAEELHARAMKFGWDSSSEQILSEYRADMTGDDDDDDGDEDEGSDGQGEGGEAGNDTTGVEAGGEEKKEENEEGGEADRKGKYVPLKDANRNGDDDDTYDDDGETDEADGRWESKGEVGATETDAVGAEEQHDKAQGGDVTASIRASAAVRRLATNDDVRARVRRSLTGGGRRGKKKGGKGKPEGRVKVRNVVKSKEKRRIRAEMQMQWAL